MHGSQSMTAEMLTGLSQCASDSGADIAVFPPFPYLSLAISAAGKGVRVGAQNVSHEEQGAFTGEVSAAMLKDLGCNMVLVGHSERRSLYHEDNDRVAEKFATALAHDLTPVLCVGETLEQREAGDTEKVVTAQIDAVIRKCGIAALGRAILAYEPVWAIGTGKTATPDMAQETHAAIRAHIAAQDNAVAEKLQILYGGSVKAGNAAELFAMADVDGGLVGGASLTLEDFCPICEAAASA